MRSRTNRRPETVIHSARADQAPISGKSERYAKTCLLRGSTRYGMVAQVLWSVAVSIALRTCQGTNVTLIATLVSNSVIVQVSDRRVSLLHRDGSVTFRDDVTNKAVLYENRATLAFTGFAELEGETTDMWIAHRLASESNLNDGLERLSADLTTLFRQKHYRGNPHSIVVAGWKRNGPDEPIGFSGLVSNHFRLGGKWLSSPNSSFDWFVEMARPDLPTLVFVPHLMPRSAAVVLYRKLLNVKERGLM